MVKSFKTRELFSNDEFMTNKNNIDQDMARSDEAIKEERRATEKLRELS